MINVVAPRVTVIVPTIGRPRYIKDTILSLLAQDYPNLEVLVSDNAASVSTPELLRSHGLSDPRLRFIGREQRLPFSAHMNACLAQAEGDFVMILSDDDQLTPGYVSEMVAFFQADPSVTVAFGAQDAIGEADTGLVNARVENVPGRTHEGFAYLEGTLSGNLQRRVLTYISLFARRADILAIGGFRDYPDGQHADNFILFSLALAGRVAVGEQRMSYRVYAASFGLGTPFPQLLQATRQYERDCARALRNRANLATSERVALLKLLHRDDFSMLRSRLRRIYLRRVSKLALLLHIASALRFMLTPVRAE